MLIIHDDTGRIEQIIMIGELEKLKTIYEVKGHRTIITNEEITIANSYVHDPLSNAPEIRERPIIEVTATKNVVVANGVDSIQFAILPINCHVAVQFEGALVYEQDIENGQIEFSTDHAGTYAITFSSSFPYASTITAIEATA